ncbi:hypothetical protein NMG60_11019693 [Bertholletia excelsa]
MNTAKKVTQGRQKIEIKKIENVSNRQVTFSKRRSGLFKKASELCVLTGAEVVVIVKSPGKRTFAFGHPSLDTVIDRYLSGSDAAAAGDPPLAAARAFNERYAEVARELDGEKRRKMAIEEAAAAGGSVGFWWQAVVEEIGVSKLEQYAAALEELKKNVGMRIDEMMLVKASSSAVVPARFGGLKTSGSFAGSGDDVGLMADDCDGALVPNGFDFGLGQF